MNKLEDKLNKVEVQLQNLFEGSAAKLSAPDAEIQALNQAILEHLSYNLIKDNQGMLIAPDNYVLKIHPGLVDEWKSRQKQLDAMLQRLQEYARENNIHFLNAPTIQITADDSLSPGDMRIETSFGTADLPQTSAVQIDNKPDEAIVPPGAYLILDGVEVFNLDEPSIKIGREPNNQLVLNNPRISRQHAQLRAIKGQFVIFDLDSSGGTTVNGELIHTHTLQAGDVISLAGIPLVYGQDSPAGEDTHYMVIE